MCVCCVCNKGTLSTLTLPIDAYQNVNQKIMFLLSAIQGFEK